MKSKYFLPKNKLKEKTYNKSKKPLTILIKLCSKFINNRNKKTKFKKVLIKTEFNPFKKIFLFTSFILIFALIFIIAIRMIKIKNKKSDCYLSSENSKLKIKHLIITRFLMEFKDRLYFTKTIYTEEYIKNGIRVMQKYLFRSLESQKCKDFTWILEVGNKANISFIKSLLDFYKPFKSICLYEKDLKNYTRAVSKGYDFLITTRIDTDDCIYYDGVNDVRKLIDINKPLYLHGYNKGVYYFEEFDKYYNFFFRSENNQDVWSVFLSLIVNLNKVNDTITVQDLGLHTYIKKTLLKEYKSYGIKEINYDPALFETSVPKFIYVRQNYSLTYGDSSRVPKKYKPINFNLSEFFGKQ